MVKSVYNRDLGVFVREDPLTGEIILQKGSGIFDLIKSAIGKVPSAASKALSAAAPKFIESGAKKLGEEAGAAVASKVVEKIIGNPGWEDPPGKVIVKELSGTS